MDTDNKILQYHYLIPNKQQPYVKTSMNVKNDPIAVIKTLHATISQDDTSVSAILDTKK